MQKIRMIILFIFIFWVVFIKGHNVYAKEMEILNYKTFIEYTNDKVDEYGEEYITEIKDILIGEFVITAYCPCSKCCGKSTGITASGSVAQANHTIAADTKILPFNTEVIINGEKYVVEDTGGAIKSNRIDMFFNTHSEALNYGKKKEKVYRQEEVTIVLKPVEFREYMIITGDLMKRKIAESYYDKTTGNVTWKNKKGDIFATRKRNGNGGYENRIEEDTYNEWLVNR